MSIDKILIMQLFLYIKNKWQPIIIFLALGAICIALVMQFFNNHALASTILLLVIVIGGIPLLLQILKKLLSGNFGADSLAAIAVITGVILQEYLAATLIILMLASGQTLENYALRKASAVLLKLAERMPLIAHRKRTNQIEDILLTHIHIKDEIIIYPHETCPVDGIVIEGNSSMDESYLTGEPYHVSKAPGATVLSGAINGEGVLTIQATKLPKDSRFEVIVKVLEEAEQKRPNLRRIGDQIGAIFAPIALFGAIGTWYFTHDAIRFLSVLVMATPCPLLIAIPITIISAISRAAKQAIIVKDPAALERLSTCKTAIFDKTGTLTYGRPTLTEISVMKPYTKKQILQYVGSIEQYSKHPLSSAVINATKEQHIPLLESTHVSEKPGQGLEGIINDKKVQITSRKKILEKIPQCKFLLPPVSPGLECIVLLNQEYAACLHFQDAPRPESKSFIKHLAPVHNFKKIMLVSGDRESEVNYLASLIPFNEIHFSQSPEQKLAIVKNETHHAPTIFMGDGINDAPALTAATIGIAFGQSSNVTAEAASVVIMENTLSKVDELLHLSVKTRQIALQSAVGGMTLSLIGMFLAALGYITPVVGALLQEVIDMLAIINALRLTWGNKIETDLYAIGDSI